jgi:hypothetical protein
MKRNDILLLLFIVLFIAAFIIFPSLLDVYNRLNQQHGMWMSFLKFAILATFGESLALRIKTGSYNRPGFGLLPKAVVWGVLGLTIKMAFVVFAIGTPALLMYLGFEDAQLVMKSGLSAEKIFVAFCISTAMNLIYAPVMMTLHRITDMHIAMWEGKLVSIIRPMKIRLIFNKIDWDSLWNFVFKKTIPLFWIPAHTITFLLPENFQVLFAAILSVLLGVILSLAIKK